MSKPARRYDVYLPVFFNDGRRIPSGRFEPVEERLLARFGGVTSHAREFPLRGIWKGPKQQFHDRVIVIAVMDFRPKGSSRFIGQLKQELLREFEQLAILITESPMRVH